MDLKPGSRWKSAVCDAEFVVVRTPKTLVTLQCGGAPLLPYAETKPAGAELSPAHSSGSAAGKRYADPDSGIETLCSKAGAGSLSVDGRPITATDAKKLPASD